MNAEPSTPPNPSTVSHPALVLVSRIDILDTKLRLLELYVGEAQAAATAEGKRLREQFQTDLSSLQAEVKQKETALETHQALAHQADRNQRRQIQELRAELLEANRLAESRQTDLTANKLAATALRERINLLENDAERNRAESTRQIASLLEHIKQLECSNQQGERNRAEIGQLQARYESELAALRNELTEKSSDLEASQARERENAARDTSAAAELRDELAATKAQLGDNWQKLEEVIAENRRLRDRLTAQNAVHERALADANRASEARLKEYRQQIADVERHIAENTTLLQQRSHDEAQIQSLEVALEKATAEGARQAEESERSIRDLEHAQRALESQLADARQEQQAQQNLNENELRRVAQQFNQQQQQLLAARALEVDALQGEASQLRQQVAQLEKAKWLEAEAQSKIADGLRSDLQRLDGQLNEKAHELAERERGLAAVQEEMLQLRDLLAEREKHQQQIGEQHAAAVDAIQQELRQVSEQLHNARELAAARDSELNQLREQAQQFSEQTAVLEQERRQAADAHHALAQSLESQLRDMHQQLEAKQQLVENRERELDSLRGSSRELQLQVADLSHAQEHAAAEYRSAFESWHNRQRWLEAQLEEWQQLVSARDREAAELQESARRLRDQLLAQQQAHQRALTEQADKIGYLETTSAARAQEFDARLAQQGDLLAQRIAELETLHGQTVSLGAQVTQLQSALEQSYAEKYEIEGRRAALQQRLDDLQRRFDEAQAALDGQRESFSALRQRLEAERNDHAQRTADWDQRLQAKEAELAQEQQQRQRREQELTQASAEVDHLRERVINLEALSTETEQTLSEKIEQLVRRHNAELADIQGRWQEREHALGVKEAEVLANQERAQAELAALQLARTEQRRQVEERDSEIAVLQGEATELRGQLREAETAYNKALQVSRAQTEQQFTTELALRQVAILQLQNELAANQSHISELEKSLSSQVKALEDQIADKEALLGQRTAALDEVHSELDTLHERLDSLHRTNETLVNDGQRLDERFRLRLSELESALADSTGFVEERSAELEKTHAEISALRQHILAMEDLHQHAQREHQAIRAALQDDLGRAQQALVQKTHHFEAETRALEAAREQVSDELRDLRGIVGERETMLSESLAVQQAQRIELAALRERTAQLDQLRRQNEQVEEDKRRAEQVSAELAVLKANLAEKERALTLQEERVCALESEHQEKLKQLQVQLAQHQLLAESRARQTEDLRVSIAVLQEQLAVVESNSREFAERRQEEFARAEIVLRSDIDELEKRVAEQRAFIETRNIEVGTLQSEKSALQAEVERLTAARRLLNSADGEGEPATYGDQLIEIANLRAEIIEKQQLLEDRNEKLIHAKGELADLQKSLERVAATQGDSLPTTVIAATNNDRLWEQLGQNDRPLERSEPAVVNDRETGFRVTFDRRHNDAATERSSGSLVEARVAELSAATADEHQGLEFLVRGGKGDGRSLPNNDHDRRWRFSLGRKRRWKS